MNKIAIVIGHNSKKTGSYSNHLKISEYNLFLEVARLMKEQKKDIDIYGRTEVGSYTNEMKEVIERINKKQYDLVIELHFNGFNGEARGCEVLHWHKSSIGKEKATAFCKLIKERALIPTRKLIEIKDNTHNGSYGIINCKFPYILVEPFFGDNKDDCNAIKDSKNIANIMLEFVGHKTTETVNQKDLKIKEAIRLLNEALSL